MCIKSLRKSLNPISTVILTTAHITDPIPKSDSSNALVPTIQSTTPAVCLLRFAGDSTSGAVMGSICSFGALQALLQSCLTFGAFSLIIEGLNKQQQAFAHSLGATVKH